MNKVGLEQFVHYQGFSSLISYLSQRSRYDVIAMEAFDAIGEIADKHNFMIAGVSDLIKDEKGEAVGYEMKVLFIPKSEE